MVDLQLLESYKKDFTVFNRKRRLIYLRNRVLMFCIYVPVFLMSMWPLALFHPNEVHIWIIMSMVGVSFCLLFWFFNTHDRLNGFFKRLLDEERELSVNCQSLKFNINTMEQFRKPLTKHEPWGE